MTRSTVFAPFDLVEGDASRGILLVCDHARRDLPQEYGTLGLPPEEFERHIAYDIGVETVTRELAALLGAPAVLAGFSRLLIDPNRGEDDPTLIRQLYDGTIITGNYPLSENERQRQARYVLPSLSRRRFGSDGISGREIGTRPFPVFGSLVHAGDAGDDPAMACRRAVGQRRSRGAAADRRFGARPLARRRRQRAL